MKRLILLILTFSCLALNAQVPIEKIVGTWKAIDDKTGKPTSYVKIFKATNGMYYGKLIDLFDEKIRNSVCTKCKDENKDKPLIGMIFMKEMKVDGDVLRGSLVDPESGNTYYGTISFENENKIKLRGSLDKKGIFGRTQYWVRKE